MGGPGQFPHSDLQFHQLCRVVDQRGRFQSTLVREPCNLLPPESIDLATKHVAQELSGSDQ